MRCIEVDVAGVPVAGAAPEPDHMPEWAPRPEEGGVVVPLLWQGNFVLTDNGTVLKRHFRVTEHGDDEESPVPLRSEMERVHQLRTLFHAPLEEGDERWIEGRSASLAYLQRK